MDEHRKIWPEKTFLNQFNLTKTCHNQTFHTPKTTLSQKLVFYLLEMIIDRSKDFESILGNLRRENNELSKNILEKRKISAYRRSMMGVAERISSIRAKVRNISIDQSDGFLSECSNSLKEISDMSFIDMPANKNESWVKHRNDIQVEMERIVKTCMTTIKKKQSKQKRKRIIAKPIVNTELGKTSLRWFESSSFDPKSIIDDF